MTKTAVLDIVGLSSSLIGKHTPFLKNYIEKNHLNVIDPMLPGLTTSVQSSYLTGKWPSEHGIVGNGWYDQEDCEIKFWKQSNKLVHAEKIWERAKKDHPDFTCAKMFWWYNMYSSADYSVTPRPNYLADGRKIPDCYAHPADLRDRLTRELGPFPLFNFWGPGADIVSTNWIAEASILTDQWYDPTLSLIYLPHLDYCLQKYGPNLNKVSKELREIDDVVKKLVNYYEKRNTKIILLSEYGYSSVNHPIHLNRIFRKNGLLQIRVERGLELLDAGASKAFVVADQQVAHVYINDPSVTQQVREILEKTEGIDLLLYKKEQEQYHINHERSGDFVCVANAESWFTYYFWLNDAVAPDYARLVSIHKKPGFDPVEVFMTSKLRAAYKVLRKKLGFRYVMDVIPLDATLVGGAHGALNISEDAYPILVTEKPLENAPTAIDVQETIWACLNS